MFIDTCLLTVVLFSLWRWKPWLAVPLLAIFFLVDIAYFAANLTKVPDGGWFPLLVGLIAFTLLTTWAKGRKLMIKRMNEAAMPAEIFIKSAANSAARVPGTAVFMTTAPDGIPHALLHNLKHNKVLHERVHPAHRADRGRALCRGGDDGRARGSRPGLLPADRPLRLHAGDRRAGGAGQGRHAAGRSSR